MTKEEALQAIKLLSALESWAFSTKNLLPDYLHEDLCTTQQVLQTIVLNESQEKYFYGTPLLDSMTKENT